MKEKERLALKESFLTLGWWIEDELQKRAYSRHEKIKLQNAILLLNEYFEKLEV